MYSLILHGRRSIELLRCRNPMILLQNASPFYNSFSSTASPLQDGRKGKTFTVSYLVDSLGLTKKLAESISRTVSFEDKGKPDSVLSLLRSNGLADSQVSSIVTSYPQVLIADAERSLAPKLQFLKSRGASNSELTEILSKVPKILRIKKDKAFSVYYDIIREVIEADKSSSYKRLCLSSLPQGSKQENKLRNVSALRDLGVPQQLLLPLLISDHQRPECIGLSPESVKEKTVFLVKEMNWPLKAVASFPEVLGLSMEKRIVPRCNVIKALISKGLIKSEQLPPLSSALVCTDQDFLKRYVRKHDDDVAELMAIFTGKTKTNR